MSLTRINQNIAAMMSQRNLAHNTWRISRSIEKLSSGIRINNASDDPSGLVISETLRTQVSGLDVAQQSVAEGINLIKTAEGALTEVNTLLRQMNDLALDAASESTNTTETRAAMQEQITSAIATIDAIAANTRYAGVHLLDGSAGTSATILDTTNIANAGLTSSAGAGYADVDVTTAATQAHVDTATAHGAATDAIDNDGSITINGVSIGSFTAAGSTVQDVIDAVNGQTSATGVSASYDAGTNTVDLDQVNYGSNQGIIFVESADILNGGNTAVQYGIDAVATTTWGDSTSSTMNAGNGLVLEDSGGNSITLTTAGNAVATYNDAAYVTQGSVSFQIGTTTSETTSMSISSTAAADLGTTGSVSSIDLSTVAGAQSAITILGEAMDEINQLRGQLGAFQNNQLEAQGRSLAVARENLAASESAIRDTDFGKEMAEFSTAQILVQSATAFLAQANALPQNVLQLIQG